MRAPWSWLLELCDPGMEPRRLAERLSMTGTEVERVTRVGVDDPEGFVVGRILSAEGHPDADRLRVCTVDTGDAEPRTIVCGAPNVAGGQTVAVALPGAVMPDGTRLGKAKLRGIESAGMILSEIEMELGADSDGIAVLAGAAAEAEPGSPLAAVLPIAEPVLELEITPNRPDCLGIYGIAREVHAITGAELAAEPWATDAEPSGTGDVDELASVVVEIPDLCPRFTARAFADVTIGPSPLWLKARLIAAGQRPISNVVDITNYVMLLTGQPLHAFDLDRVPGGEVIVRTARPGERMRTLDDVERELDEAAVLVCDRDGPTGLAGIMGGQVSEVSAATTRVLLESANWNGTNILRTSNAQALRSEASTRFEKGLHPDLTMRAQRVASRLMLDLCGARLVPGTIDVDAGGFEPRKVSLRPARADSLLGMEVPRQSIHDHLSRLGFGTADAGEEITVAVPPDRHFDIVREVDVIEEIARVHGLDENLPATLPERGAGPGGLERHQRLLRRAEDALAAAGVDEAITWSFGDPARGRDLDEDAPMPAVVHNPLSEVGSAMRTGLIGGLIDAAAHNLARGAERVALFESGRVYLPRRSPQGGGVLAGSFAGVRPAPIAEPHRIGCLICGPLRPASWRDQQAAADFYDAKGLLELLCAAVGADVAVVADARPYLHPARAGAVMLGEEEIGWVGELHPRVLASIGARSGAGFEIDAGPLLGVASAGIERFEDVTTHPPLSEDIAVVADHSIAAERIRGVVVDAGGELLRSAVVFDVYEGEQVEAGKRSLALRLAFGAPDRTLTDEEVAGRRKAIVAALDSIGATLRG